MKDRPVISLREFEVIAPRAQAGSRGPIGSGPKNDPRSANGSLDPRESLSVARWLDLGAGLALAKTGLGKEIIPSVPLSRADSRVMQDSQGTRYEGRDDRVFPLQHQIALARRPCLRPRSPFECLL